MKNNIFVYIFAYMFFCETFGRNSWVTSFFPHLVDDISAINAQRNFAIGWVGLWLAAVLFNPIYGMTLDKTKRGKEMLLIVCLLKAIYYFGFSISTNEIPALVFIILSGTVCSLRQISFYEISRLINSDEKPAAINYLNAGAITGGLCVSLFRLLPDFNLSIFYGITVTANTLPMLTSGILCLSAIPLLIYVYTVIKPSTQTLNEKHNVSVKAETDYVTIFVLFLISFATGITWEVTRNQEAICPFFTSRF